MQDNHPTDQVQPSADQRNSLRRQLLKTRAAISKRDADRWSTQICERVWPVIEHCSLIGGYLAMGREVSPDPLRQVMMEHHQVYHVPVIGPNNTMTFARLGPDTILIKNRLGIKEPLTSHEARVNGVVLDAVLVPLVGFDKLCNRMGMGGGYYDRCFASRNRRSTSPKLIGLAYDLQCVDSVLPAPWDVPLDIIVTQSRTIVRPSG